MSMEERPPAEERDGGTREPEHGQVISNRPDVSDADAGPDGADEDDEDDEDTKTTTKKTETMKRTPTT